jgi:hypothetical protein
MKKHLLPVLLASLTFLAGCTTIITPQGERYQTCYGRYSIVNNSGFKLDIFQDGLLIFKDLDVGQVYPVRPMFLQSKTVIVVTGHTEDGEYVGTDQWIFLNSTPEAWTVTRLYQPKPPR